MTVISDQSDSSLLQEYATQGSQEAFTELVSRHSAWVYSAAVRMVRDRHLAEDVAQAVFLVLADKAGKLGAVPLHRWLFKVTRYASANAIRSRTRRDKYERLAAMSTSEALEADPEKMWEEIAPLLDDLMDRLHSQDRDALLMRFYQQKNMAEVAIGLGVSEGAAKIRIVRAVEKLRGLLRGRGVVVPAIVLSTVLVDHTTQAAPAAFMKGCFPAAASSKAAIIAKGASTMLFTAKIKFAIIVAMVLIGCAIPIGAGVYYLDVAPDAAALKPQPALVQSEMGAAAQAQDTNPGIDPQVAPFVTNQTDVIIAVDLTRLDMDAVAADMLGELGRSQIDPASAGRIRGMILMGQMSGKQWINGFKQAGGTSLYALLGANDLTLTPQAGFSSLKLTASLIYPTASPAAAQTLAKYLTRPGSAPLKIVDNTVVDVLLSQPSLPAIPGLSAIADPRPALAAGLSSGGDNPVRAAVNPAALKAILPKLMGSANIASNFATDNWDDVASYCISLALPPVQPSGFVVTYVFKNPVLAAKGKTAAMQRLAQGIKFQPGTNSLISARALQFVGSEKIDVNGSTLTGTMDLHTYWDLIFTAMSTGMQYPTSRPQQPTNSDL